MMDEHTRYKRKIIIGKKKQGNPTSVAKISDSSTTDQKIEEKGEKKETITKSNKLTHDEASYIPPDIEETFVLDPKAGIRCATCQFFHEKDGIYSCAIVESPVHPQGCCDEFVRSRKRFNLPPPPPGTEDALTTMNSKHLSGAQVAKRLEEILGKR